MENEIVRLAPLPPKVNAVVLVDENGDYNIYVNARLNADTRANAYRHEIEHIRQGHFYQERPVADLEREARHGKGKENEERQVDDAGVRLHGSTRDAAL